MKVIVLLFFLVCGSLWGEAVEIPRKIQKLEGWTVRVDERLLEGGELHEEFGARAIATLTANLVRLSALVPKTQLTELRKVTIVLDEHPQLKAAQYHPSRKWLIENGYEASLAKCVHLSRASFFANPEHIRTQPSVTLHELAHAYHDQVLSFDHPDILKAFQAAKEKGQYQNVLHISGREGPHYAATNHKEYFAEATEAWFGCNDFYPFVRPELKRHDARLYQIMEEVWGKAGQ